MFKQIAAEVRGAFQELLHETQCPVTLELIDGEGQSRIIPNGKSYAITANPATTEDDIYDLEPQLERLAENLNEVYAAV